jgi:hypothetical protein
MEDGLFHTQVHLGTISDVQIDLQTKLVKQQSFLEYIRYGCQINLMVAIDFTGSNGYPSSSRSLHYIHPNGQYNDYQQAIKSVGTILAEYDSDNSFPVWGFVIRFMLNSPVLFCLSQGAVVKGSMLASPVFNANFESDPYVKGVDGIMEVYRKAVHGVSFSGPTNFAPVINQACSLCSEQFSKDSQKYGILLILTDGEISDMSATTNAIIKGSALPLSIIIVGVCFGGFVRFLTLSRLEMQALTK